MTDYPSIYRAPYVAGSPPPPRRPQLPWVITAVLCAIAIAAVVIAVPAVRGADRPKGPAGPQPLAPGVAALSNERLAELLLQRREFPAGWSTQIRLEPFDTFGYYTAQPSARGLSVSPAECFAVIGGALVGDSAAAEVSGHNPADPPIYSDRRDIRLRISREYNPAGFDDMITLVTRCQRFTATPSPRFSVGYTVKILENTLKPVHPADPAKRDEPVAHDGPQRFRYTLTTQYGGAKAGTAEDYFSYARFGGVVLTGSGSDGHQDVFDAAFDKALTRIRTAAR